MDAAKRSCGFEFAEVSPYGDVGGAESFCEVDCFGLVLSIAAVSSRVPESRVAELVEQVQQVATQVTESLDLMSQ